MSRQLFANGSAIEEHLRAAAGGAGALVDGDGRGDVLQRRAGAVEDRDLVRPYPPGRRPMTTSPSSAWICSRVTSPAASTCCTSPISAHCASTSTTTVALATSASSSSCFPGASAPTAAMKVPGATSEAATRGRRDGVQVTHTSLPPQGLAKVLGGLHVQAEAGPRPLGQLLGLGVVDIEDPGLLQRQDRGDRGELHLTLDAAAHDRGRPRLTARQELRRDSGRRGGAQGGHAARFDHREGLAAAGISEDHHALDGRQPEAPSGCRESWRSSWPRSSCARPAVPPP